MPDKTQPSEFYSAKSLYTLAGGATTTWIITNFYTKILPNEPVPSILIALIIAQIISIVGYVTLTREKKKLSGYFIAVINGFLIASSALGLNTANSSVAEKTAGTKDSTRQSSLISFLDKTAWLPPAKLVQEVREKSDSIDVIIDTLTKANFNLTISNKENEILYREIIPENSVKTVPPIQPNPGQQANSIDSLSYRLVNVKLASRQLEQRSRENQNPNEQKIIHEQIRRNVIERQSVNMQMQRVWNQRNPRFNRRQFQR